MVQILRTKIIWSSKTPEGQSRTFVLFEKMIAKFSLPREEATLIKGFSHFFSPLHPRALDQPLFITSAEALSFLHKI